MNITAFNRTDTAFWMTMVMRQELGAEGPENVIIVLVSKDEIDADRIKVGEFLICKHLVERGIATFEDLPDSERRPVFVTIDEDFAPPADMMVMPPKDGSTRILLLFRNEGGGGAGLFEAPPDPDADNDLESPADALRLRNRISKPVCVTLMLTSIDDGNDRVLMIYLSAKRPPKAALGSAKIIKQRILHPNHELLMRRLPSHEVIAIGMDDELESHTEESAAMTPLGRTVEIDILPPDPEQE